jgi:rRNA maturation endonuclease Nob1
MANPTSERPTASAPVRSEWVHVCARCGERMEERKCKIVCQNCGAYRDCSDP